MLHAYMTTVPDLAEILTSPALPNRRGRPVCSIKVLEDVAACARRPSKTAPSSQSGNRLASPQALRAGSPACRAEAMPVAVATGIGRATAGVSTVDIHRPQ